MSNFTRAMFNAYSTYLKKGVEQVPNNVKINYRNKIARGNYRAAFNAISKYLPYYKRNNLANLVGQFNTHPAQAPIPYNATRVNIKRNNNAKPFLNRARAGNSKRMVNILMPYRGGKGGVQLGYYNKRVNKNPVKYAMVNRGSGNLYAFALLKNNTPVSGSRYINIVGGLKGYGGKLIKQIINNARANNRNSVTLKAVVSKFSNVKDGKRIVTIPVNNNGERNKLVSLYEHLGFNTNGKFINSNGLQPMIMYLKNKNMIKNKRRRENKRKANIIASMLTPRVTRSRA